MRKAARTVRIIFPLRRLSHLTAGHMSRLDGRSLRLVHTRLDREGNGRAGKARVDCWRDVREGVGWLASRRVE